VSVAILPIRDHIASKPLPVYRFTVKQYHRMIEAGILTNNDRVELLQGWIVPKMAQMPLHAGTITRITRRLAPLLPSEWLLRVQSAITLPQSEPEPDLAIARGPEEIYLRRHPGPRDIRLLIEVAGSSLLDDCRHKGEIYAAARIPHYWIVNLVDRVVEVYTRPRAGKAAGYRTQHVSGIKESISLILAGGEVRKIRVSDLLP
jgi:Uma2 family endonuclease